MAASASTATTSTLLETSDAGGEGGSTSEDGKMSSKYQYLSSLNDIQTIKDLTEDGVRDILRNFTCDHTLSVTRMGKLEDMSGLNDAFNSTICSMKLETKRSGSDDRNIEEEFNFVIKSPPKISFVRQIHKLTQPFFNEVTWYLDLIKQLELANGPGCIDNILPKCYHAYSSYYNSEGDGFCAKKCPWFCYIPCKPSDEGILILENITKPTRSRSKVYSMFDKRVPLPLDHVNLIVTELAHFHGKWLKWKSMAQKKLLGPEAMSWDTFRNSFNTQNRIPQVIYKQLGNVARKTVIRLLKMKGGPDMEDHLNRCRRFFDHTAPQQLNTYMHKAPTPVHTLVHGDFWSNNIMFSYEGDKVQDLKIIDYQLITYGHPCYDLVYFMYINTDLAFRDEHLIDVLKTYFHTFQVYVKDYVEDCTYTFEDFMNDYNWYKTIGFTTACSVMPNVLSDNQLEIEGILALRELQRKQERELTDETNVAMIEIRRRISDMVHEMTRDGVI